MDQFFQELLQRDALRYEPVLVNQSAFVPYVYRPRDYHGGPSGGNMKKRMIEFLRASWQKKIRAQEPERERCYRHMLNERMRRERQKRSYLALHALLPPATKNEKNAIVQRAAKRIHELQYCKEELEQRKNELEANLVAKEKTKVGGTKITVKVPNPTSGVDSMVEVLKCIKNMGSRTTTIQAKFSAQEFSAAVDIETKTVAGEIEKAVHTTLQEVERRLLFHIQEAHQRPNQAGPDFNIYKSFDCTASQDSSFLRMKR